MEVIWSDLAHKSLTDVLSYVAKKFGDKKAYGVYVDIKKFVANLGEMPRIGTAIDKWSKYGEIRKVVHKQDNIYYHVKDDQLVIIMVWDTRQSPLRLENMVLRYYISWDIENKE